MLVRFRKFVDYLSDAFWAVPALHVAAAILLAFAAVGIDRSGIIPPSWLDASILYNGGGTGARTMLGAIATSTISVASTIFSITIAALTLAAGQMGPRLLLNFTRDRGNQATLGIYLGTFAYTLVVLTTVRTVEEGAFVPHLALTVGVLLAFLCIATLVYFIAHIAGRISVDTVIDLVATEMRRSIRKLLAEEPEAKPPPEEFWMYAGAITQPHSGYLQHLDTEGLANWAREHETAIRLLVRPGQFVFPGAPIAVAVPPIAGISEAIVRAIALSSQRSSTDDLELSARQLVEVALRALSPGINDPLTAISVLDRLGEALCEIAVLHFSSGVTLRDGVVALVVPITDYEGLADTMLQMIRQNAVGNASVLIRMLEVLAVVAKCDTNPARRKTLHRHAGIIWHDAQRSIRVEEDLADIRSRYDLVAAALGADDRDGDARL